MRFLKLFDKTWLPSWLAGRGAAAGGDGGIAAGAVAAAVPAVVLTPPPASPPPSPPLPPDRLVLENGKLLLFRRGRLWQARVHLGGGRYLWRSLRTDDPEAARRHGLRLLHETDLKLAEGMPVRSRSFSAVLDEYLDTRRRDHAEGVAAGAGRDDAGRRFTSAAMLRQLERVARYWRAYAGDRPIEAIDDAALRGYIPWRRRYWHGAAVKPPTARLDPADTTLRWEMMVGRLVVKFAQGQGYRGGRPAPAFTFVPSLRRARPAFSLAEYRRLAVALHAWADMPDRADRVQLRRLLRDYVHVLAASGLRVGEANALRWRDVEPFRDGRGRPNIRLHVRGKTGARVVIPRVAAARHLARLRGWTPFAGPDDFVFARPDGGAIGTLAAPFNAVLARAGLSTAARGGKFTLYSLRHFYAVQAIARDLDVYTLARNMGTSVAMIEQHYGRDATPQSRADRLGG